MAAKRTPDDVTYFCRAYRLRRPAGHVLHARISCAALIAALHQPYTSFATIYIPHTSLRAAIEHHNLSGLRLNMSSEEEGSGSVPRVLARNSACHQCRYVPQRTGLLELIFSKRKLVRTCDIYWIEAADETEMRRDQTNLYQLPASQ